MSQITVHDIASAITFRCGISLGENEYERIGRVATDEWRTWEAAINAGWSYMMGTHRSRERYLSENTTSLIKWQRVAFAYCLAHPLEMVQVDSQRRNWEIKRRGEYVEFCLPGQEHGGYRCWISRDGKTKVLVNVD